MNATPDIGDQIESEPALRPTAGTDESSLPEEAPRHTPIAGIILTDGELDHTLGIFRLREADQLRVYATSAVRSALLDRLRLGDVLAPYTELGWCDLPPGRPVQLGEHGLSENELDAGGQGGHGQGERGRGVGGFGSVEVEGIGVSAKRPRYAADRPPDGGWVTALRLVDRETGGVAVYAPALGVWPPALEAAMADADCVIIDGTYWDDEEPRRAGISTRTATETGHLPIHGPGGTAMRLAALDGRCLYTHLNNTNPLVDPAAPEHKVLAELGIEVARDGMVIEL